MRPSPQGSIGRPLALVATALLASTAPAAAQQLTVSPTVGLYVPATSLVSVPGGPVYSHTSELVVGARLGLALGPRFGLEASLSHTPADRQFTRGGLEGTERGNLLFGSARATVNLTPAASPVWLRVSGGASLVHRGGEALYYRSDDTDLGGVVGTAIGIDLGQRLSLYLAADDYVYRYSARYQSPDNGHEYTAGGTQHDVHLTVGLGIPLRTRGGNR